MSEMNVQELIKQELFTDTTEKNDNDMLQILEFMKVNGVPLTQDQTMGMFLLNEMGLGDIAVYANQMRPEMTPTKKYYDMVNKITLADRIKGSARLDKLLKAQVANPNNTMPQGDVQAKALKEKELNR